jgi:hypothetical protein
MMEFHGQRINENTAGTYELSLLGYFVETDPCPLSGTQRGVILKTRMDYKL